jgi:hypothetical protein
VLAGLGIVIGAPRSGSRGWHWLSASRSAPVRARACIPIEQGDALYLALEDTRGACRPASRTCWANDVSGSAQPRYVKWAGLALDGDEPLHRWCEAHPTRG